MESRVVFIAASFAKVPNVDIEPLTEAVDLSSVHTKGFGYPHEIALVGTEGSQELLLGVFLVLGVDSGVLINRVSPRLGVW